MTATDPAERPVAARGVLTDTDRRHLGRLLAAAYPPAEIGPDAGRLSGLVAQISAALRCGGDGGDAAFHTGLMGMLPALRRFAVSLTHDPNGADDLVQDTVLKAWRNRASFLVGTNLEAWTFTIMRNQFYTSRRKQGREVQDQDDAHAAQLAVLPDQVDHLDLKDVCTALDRLAPPMREALVLVAVHDLSYEEAAVVMGCAVGTAKSRVWRARNQLTLLLGYTGAEIGQDGLTLSALDGADGRARLA